MDIVIEQINSVGKAFVDFMWPMLWQSSVLIAILLVLDFMLRRKVRAVFRYCLWMLVLAKLFLPTTLSSPVSIGLLTGNALPAINIAATERPVGGDITNILPYSPRTAETGEASVALHAEAPIQSQAVTPVVSLTREGGIFLVWLMVVCAMLLLLMQRAVFVFGLVRQSAEANDLMNDALKFCCKLMGVRQTIRLKISPNATSPAVCGLFRPVILVPQGLGPSLGIGPLRVVMMHELAHIKRGDLWVNLIQTLLQIVYFYNPLLWLANWAIRRVREQAVDEAVQVALGERAQQYPETLLNVARLAFERPALSLRLIGVVESRGALTSRIKRMLTRPIPKSAKLGILGMAVILIFAAILLPMARASQKSAVDNAFRKQLPNGVTVELVGVCDYPSKGRQWWRPDGSPLGFDIETQDTSNYTDKNKAYEIAYKVEAPNDVSVGWPKIQGSTSQSGLEVNSPSGIQAARSHINVWGNTTKIKFPVAAGEWTTLGQTTGQVQSNTTVGSQKLMFGPAEGTREKLVLTTSDDIKSEDDYRLVAFDKQGNLHTSSKNWFSIKDLRQSTFVFVNLDSAAVDRFEFQTRPYQWIEFKNVSLRPTGKWNWQTGTRTTPDFTIKGIVTDAQTGKPIAGAKVGDTERYAGGKYWAVTDSSGNYSYKTWYEEHGVKCEAAGYKTENKILLTKVLGSEREKVLDFTLSSKGSSDNIDYASATIKEGVGFDGFIVGDANCTGEFIKAKLGEPEKENKDEQRGWWLVYRKKYGLDFWLNLPVNTLQEIRLNRGFKGKLTSGISMSSTKQDVFKTYGEPIREEAVDNLGNQFDDRVLFIRKDGVSRIDYREKGVLFWFEGDKINQIRVGAVSSPGGDDTGTKTDAKPDENAIDYSFVTVQEGVGFDGFTVGDANCTGEFIKAKLGKPEQENKDERQGRWIAYRQKYGLDFWLNMPKDTLSEIRLNKGFKGKLSSGISMSSTKQDVFTVYGQPLSEKTAGTLSRDFSYYENRVLFYNKNPDSGESRLSKIYYSDKGILFWFDGDKISQIVIYHPDSNKHRVVGIGPGWERLQRVIGDNYRGSIGGYSDDEQKCGEYFETVLSWARPGDTFVMMFAFDEEKFGHSQMVPQKYQDMLPKPWLEIKEQIERGEVVELKGKARGLDTIVLAAPTLDQLDELIKSTELLQPFKTNEKIISGTPIISAAEFGKTEAKPEKSETGYIDLLKQYPTTLTGASINPQDAREWQFTSQDIYSISRFSFDVNNTLHIKIDSADLGIGHCKDGAVWAVVIPREHGTIKSSIFGEELIGHLWLRFHPGEVLRLFPKDTVIAGGDKNLWGWMNEIARVKINSSWQAGGRAMIPAPKDFTVDADTKKNVRRFFVVDSEAKTAEYIAFFEGRTVPAQTSSNATQKPYRQEVYDEIGPDGTITFKNTIRETNRSNSGIAYQRFINSDFVHVTDMNDGEGRALKFTSVHDGDVYRYEVTFNKPIPPGQVVEYAMEGTMDGLVKPVAGEQGVFQYYMMHSPAVGEPTQRIETYLLPAGAELISTTPEDMEKQTKEGRIELHVEKMIPIGGSITTSFKYRMP